MERKKLKACLMIFSTIKKNLELSPLTEEAWYQSLSHLSNEDGEAAFRALMRMPVMGDIEPAHVLIKHEELEAKRALSSNGNEWISKAPKFDEPNFEFPTKEFCAFLERERPKRYRSYDTRTDEILLIQNPAAWEWKIINGRVSFIRPEPIHTGIFMPKKKQSKPWESSK